ncbi:MAG: SDR family oxidoreductase [Pseudomonadota bacterium]
MSNLMHDLDGKVAIVTGAGKGIGRAIALAYARAGAAECCAARTENELCETAAQIVEMGGRAIAVATNVSQLASVEAMVRQTIDAFGGVDIAMLNAGIGGNRAPLMDIPPETWREVVDVNLMGAYYSVRAVVPALKLRGGGKIIMMGSGLGHVGTPGTSAYACAKAGMAMLSSVLAQELWSDGITVNEIVPGPVNTGIGGPSMQAMYDQLTKIGEWVKLADDVVPMAMFLATQPSTGPTGQVFSIARRPL